MRNYDQWATAAPPEQVCATCKTEWGVWVIEDGIAVGDDVFCSQDCADKAVARQGEKANASTYQEFADLYLDNDALLVQSQREIDELTAERDELTGQVKQLGERLFSIEAHCKMWHREALRLAAKHGEKTWYN